MYSCTSGVRPAIVWLRFSRASAAASVGVSTLCQNTSLVRRSPVAVKPAIPRELERGAVELVVADQAADEADPLGFLGVDLAPGDDHVEGPSRADEARQQVADPDVGARQAGADERRAEPGGAGGDAQVGGARQREPAAVRGPVDRGDDDLGRLAHVLGEVGDELLEADTDARVGVLPRGGDGAPVLEVEARGEPLPGAGEEHDAGLGVAADLVERVVEPGDELVVHGVEPIGTVQRDPRDVRLGALHEHDGHEAPQISGGRGHRRR